MEQKKVEVLYHEPTGTYWTNSKDWKEVWKKESIMYGESLIPDTNVFVVKTKMHKQGLEMIKKHELEGTPFTMDLQHNNEG
ncbi:hypothetical protein [Bacillus phage vB_BanS-Thrax5]|nr:hypothetical protein [Bacillus phage vB_BanS-Thrax5]